MYLSHTQDSVMAAEQIEVELTLSVLSLPGSTEDRSWPHLGTQEWNIPSDSYEGLTMNGKRSIIMDLVELCISTTVRQ